MGEIRVILCNPNEVSRCITDWADPLAGLEGSNDRTLPMGLSKPVPQMKYHKISSSTLTIPDLSGILNFPVVHWDGERS